MKVILCDDIAKVGSSGEIKDVSAGFARNFLLPKGLAMAATPSNLRKWEADAAQRQVKLGKTIESAKNVAAQIEKISPMDMPAKVGKEGHLFGSITSQMIAETLSAKGVGIDKKTIVIETPIKTLGEHTISIRLHAQVEASLKINVVSDQVAAPAPA